MKNPTVVVHRVNCKNKTYPEPVPKIGDESIHFKWEGNTVPIDLRCIKNGQFWGSEIAVQDQLQVDETPTMEITTSDRVE